MGNIVKVDDLVVGEDYVTNRSSAVWVVYEPTHRSIVANHLPEGTELRFLDFYNIGESQFAEFRVNDGDLDGCITDVAVWHIDRGILETA